MNRKGVTVTEVVVVLVILLVLVGVVLAFLRKMRATADQAQCANNLRIIGEGAYEYAGGFPREALEKFALNAPLPGARIADGYATWAVLLAPYIAGPSPLKDWDLRKPYAEQPAEIREAIVPLYFCPARNRSSFLSIKGGGPGGENIEGALGDYACASADGDPRFPFDSAKANGAIILGEVLQKKGDLILRWQSRTDYTSLQRGLSNTILIGDKFVPLDGLGQAAFGDGSLYNGGQPASFSRVGGPGFGLAPSAGDPFNKQFGSNHPGVCMFLMADDSVRPIANNISEEILGQLIRREEK
jgi:Protein of unknown function (DUF1559)